MDIDDLERAALVALLQRSNVRWSRIASDILDRGSALELLHDHVSSTEGLFPSASVEELLATAQQQIHAWARDGISVHAFFDPQYPSQLRDIREMPPILFSSGTLQEDTRAIAVVGTREATEEGLHIASAVASELASNEVTVVSGLARGIDTASHRAALASSGRTVAVIGTGLQRHYPPENRQLQNEIAAKGLVISQFLPDSPPTKQSFPMRNAVMSGYAAATVVVEAGARSGARIQARLALEHGRPVVMPEQLLKHDWALDFASRPGVTVVANLAELLSTVESLIQTTAAVPEILSRLPSVAGV
ncbi:MAG: DNA-processing protein DprA [Catenulispora sp.]